ncbi:hypothetical protein EVB41_005 [Rhizobium phage RHph_TM3_14A]|nr:hypothetical protein EVB29_005 [Rhizobium phage RHph_TM27A]QIG66925.1 hypothetical protein EVB30_005 [Rhizobium phage RHph_TM27B]QIG67015.1 hypothetical protein EVB31_005 [Rhizobium phage RHph_TM29]QIG67470.1 hypothetical protein EVB41_005 [Rhizobium phage RHph_TM3_14A]
MPYVSRDINGNINGLYEQLQEGYAEEFLLADDPEVVAFLNPPPPPYVIPADIPWNRMTEEEAELVQAGIDASTIKTRNMINKATSFTQGTDAFNKFHAIIAAATDSTRANEIMGPMTAEEMAMAVETM